MVMSRRQKKHLKSTRPDPRVRFDKKDILAIVKEVEDGLSRKSACRKYGIAYITICNWLRLHSAHYDAHKPPSYSMAFKRSIAQPILEGRMSVRQASVSNNIKTQTVSSWVRQLKKQDSDLTAGKNSDKSSGDTMPSHDELRLAQLKIQALETMIDFAEEQFKINIRKKPGAKQ
jgi:transposase